MPEATPPRESSTLDLSSVLKTPEAKGAFIYERARRQFPIEGVERANREEFYKETELRLKIGDYVSQFPPTLAEGAKTAVALAFKDRKFQMGFFIARTYGIAEEIATVIEGVSVPQIDWAQRVSLTEKTVEPFQTLPGFQLDKTQYSCMSSDILSYLIDWASEVKSALVTDYLVPSKQFQRAIAQNLSRDRGQEAVQIASENLTLEETLDVCIRAQTGFSFISPDIFDAASPELKLKFTQAHVNSFVNGTNKERGIGGPERWTFALQYAKQYGFDKEYKKQIAEKGVQQITADFEEGFVKLEKQIRELREEEGKLERRTWRYGCFTSDNGVGKVRDKIKYLSESRYGNIQLRDNIHANVLFELVKVLPAAEAQKAKRGLLEICKKHDADAEAFAIALELEDYAEAYPLAKGTLYRLNHARIDGGKSYVRSRIENDILPKLNKDSAGDYISILLFREPIEEDREFSTARRIAAQWGLSDWLIDSLEREHPTSAANIALEIGQIDRAKKIYFKNKQYGAVRNLTDNPLELASLSMLQAKLIIRRRTNDSFPSMYRRPIHEELKPEIETMEQSIALASPHLNNTSDQRYGDYVAALTEVRNSLLSKGQYAEACLLIEASQMPFRHTREIDSFIVDAEKRKDFAGCYYLAKLAGKEQEAQAYRQIATTFNQQMPSKLSDLLLPPKPRETQTPKATEPGILGGEDDDYDMPF